MTVKQQLHNLVDELPDNPHFRLIFTESRTAMPSLTMRRHAQGHALTPSDNRTSFRTARASCRADFTS
jgi:hypothetical protein